MAPDASTPELRDAPPPPLDGITVVDFTVNVAGPFASLLMRDLGARVIKLEPPSGDDSRGWPPYLDGVATIFAAFNRGKESVAVDAKHPEGRALIERLVAGADVFLESLRPGKAAALGLGYEHLERLNPRLIYCSINAFGSTGPMADVAGFDAIVQAYSGIMDLTGEPDGPPNRTGAGAVDVGSGMWAAISVMGALRQRDVTGAGQRVEATLLGTATAYVMHHLAAIRLTGANPRRLGTAQHNFAPYQAIRAQDGMVMVGVNAERLWQRFCDAVGDDGRLRGDARFAGNEGRLEHRLALVAAIEALTGTLTAAELLERLRANGIPSSIIRSATDLAYDPQLEALNLWGTTGEGMTLPRVPTGLAIDDVGAIPGCGAHTRKVLAELGFSDADIAGLEERGVVVAAG